MQALIDFNGWRRWKDFSARVNPDEAAAAAAAAVAAATGAGNIVMSDGGNIVSSKKTTKAKKAKNRLSLSSTGGKATATTAPVVS